MRDSLLSLLSLLCLTVSSYNIVHDFSGIGFFDAGNWDFYGNYDNLTLGDVVWLDEPTAYSQQLALVNAAGNVILKVDNFSNVPFNQKRNSVRLTSKATYSLGSLWIIDAVHLPYGCSVWPSIWTVGPSWPDGGEIDIIEGINMMPNNQYAVHTTPGCLHTTPPDQTGTSSLIDCSQPSGCLVGENTPNSFQSGFAAAGGGVWAAQFDYTGIFIWFWSRANVPASIREATATSSISLSDWGTPSASYVNTTCKIEDFFAPQNLVIDITLCGQWAGIPANYQETCAGAGPTGICYNDNVVGSGSNYNEAYFELKYIRAYTTAAPGPTIAALGNKSGGARSMRGWPPLLVVLVGVILGMMMIR
ncbi:glycoside hydrolase family 16 protein [Mycena belliarum]|uniref:Glycoside hydrolase family 16 protein n=1 Tax=Mycena belliarum TaxID=1033014 RepID=A0AAD6TQE8_9AGAR|nr:glycoside hydrolase family 16 protein [Mycena belliae]